MVGIKKLCKWSTTVKFILHGWIKTVNAGNANIQVRYYNSRQGYQIGNEYITADISGNTEWTWYYKGTHPPSQRLVFRYPPHLHGASSGQTQALFVTSV